MTHGSLFSGIGGFDLAARWAGWTNLFNCEIDPFCQTVLACHFPDAKQYSDIRSTNFTFWRGLIDVLSGGFPCQPFSLAGKRKGTEDDRHLWPEMLRAIREISPHWVVGENVLGIVNWSDGLVFEQACVDLEAQGYEVQPYVLPACSVDAPHLRYRTWFVAHRTDARAEDVQRGKDRVLSEQIIADTDGDRLPRCRNKREPPESFSRFPTQSPVCSRNDGLPAGLDGITFPKWRRESIKAYGNAIVPMLAYRIFEMINEYELNEWKK